MGRRTSSTTPSINISSATTTPDVANIATRSIIDNALYNNQSRHISAGGIIISATTSDDGLQAARARVQSAYFGDVPYRLPEFRYRRNLFPARLHFGSGGLLFFPGSCMPKRLPDGVPRRIRGCINHDRDLVSPFPHCLVTIQMLPSSAVWGTACQRTKANINFSCPTLKNMPDMSCYDGSGTPDTMAWFQCRAAVPATGLTLSVAGPDLDARGTYTALQTVTSPAVIYAYGVKMVYQATDLTTSSPGSATSSTGLPLPLSEPATSSTLPIGAIVALGVAIPLGVLGALVAAFLVWRGKKRQRESMAIAAPWEKSHELPTKSHEGMLGSSLYEMASEEMRSEMPGTGQPVELGG